MLTYLMDAHSDKLKNIPLRTQVNIDRFTGKTLFDLVEYGAGLHEFAAPALVHVVQVRFPAFSLDFL